MSIVLRAVCAAGTAAVAVYLLAPFIRLIALRRGAVAKPVDDRWGKRRVTRFGGIAICGGTIVAMLLWVPFHAHVLVLLVGLLCVCAIGFADDIRPLRPYTKLLLQLAIGCLIVMGGVRIELIRWLWLSVPLSVLWFVLVMNAFNLLDNMDGLAAGIGAIAAIYCAAQALMFQQQDVGLAAAVIAGACLGFLRYNFPPAKMFMGDSGSHLLGLSLGALALMGSWKHSTQLLSVLAVPMLVLAVPIFDTCFVTCQRLLHRRHPFQGGTDHLSHRLVILGLSQRQTVLVLYAVGAAFGLCSLASISLKPLQAIVLWLFAIALLVLGGAFLAKVNVYEMRREPHAESDEGFARPVTLIETMLLHKRRLLEVLTDFLLICGAYALAHLLRFEGVLDLKTQEHFIRSLPLVVVIKLLCFMGFGLYRGVWKYISLPDIIAIAKAVTLSSLCSATTLLYLWRFQGFSRAVFVIDWLLLFLAVSGARVAERLLSEWISFAAAEEGVPVLIIGAGDMGDLLLRQLRQRGGPEKRRVMGFLDDDPKKQGNRIHGLPVLGTRRALSDMLQLLGVREVLVAMHCPPPDLIEQVRGECTRRHIPWHLASTMTADS